MTQNSHLDSEDPVFKHCPYPGMRPFEASDARYFCGRDRHIEGVIDRLRSHHFVAVTGGSGSGKSSLIRAGVIPYLKLHGLEAPGQVWVIVLCKPGKRPLENLKEALLKTLVDAGNDKAKAALSDQLQGWPDIASFLDLYRDEIDVGPEDDKAPQSRKFSDKEIATRRKRINLLLLIDQFEEIFDDDVAPPPDTERFVDLIAPSSEYAQRTRRDRRVFTIVTIRSENLRSLGTFPVLPDLFTETQYHVGPLRGHELRAAIEEPAHRFVRSIRRTIGGCDAALPDQINVEPALVHSMVAGAVALRHDPDHLFLVQHTARAVWLHAAARWRADNSDEWSLTRRDFDTISGQEPPPKDGTACALALKAVLNAEADAVFSSLGSTGRGKQAIEQQLAERLFRQMAYRDDRGWPTRRETTRAEVLAIAGDEDPPFADKEALERVIAAFLERHPFIRDDRGVLDVAHEALTRNWSKFGDWLKEEDQARRDLRKLIQEYDQWRPWRWEREPLKQWQMRQYQGWTKYRRNDAWHEAQRQPDETSDWNASDLDNFWKKSENREWRQRWRMLAYAAVGGAAVFGFGLYLYLLSLDTTEQLLRASEISHAGFQLAADSRTIDDNVRLNDAIILQKSADRLREELKPPTFSFSSLREQFDELERSLIDAERITLDATLRAISRRVNWEKATERFKPIDEYTCYNQQGRPVNGMLMADKDVDIAGRDFKIIAFQQQKQVPYGPNHNSSPIVTFGFINEVEKCQILPVGGFQLRSGRDTTVHFDLDMEIAMNSWQDERSEMIHHQYHRILWAPICLSKEKDNGSVCNNVGVEIWTESVWDGLITDPQIVEKSKNWGPSLPRAHIANILATQPVGADIKFVDVDNKTCEPEGTFETCKYSQERGDFAIRLRTRKDETETEHLHREVDVLKVKAGDTSGRNNQDSYIEIASLQFRAPEVEKIGFDDQQQPDNIFLQLKNGLGWYQINLQRESLLESACDEREALDLASEKVQHFESFDSFIRRNKDWLDMEHVEPCP